MLDLDILKQKFNISNFNSKIIENEIISSYLDIFSPVSKNECIILGAQPGAGKSILEKEAFVNLNKNGVICNVDNLKNYHPNAEEIARNYPDYFSEITGPFAHQWNLALRNHCIKNKYNFILETTFSNGAAINSIINNLKANNVKSNIYLLAVPKQISLIGTLVRYELNIKELGFARKVSLESHNFRFNEIPNAIKEVENKGLYDKSSIYVRNLTQSLSNELNGISLINNNNTLLSSYLKERDRLLPQKALKYINDNVEIIMKCMTERSAAKSELNELKEIINKEFIKLSKKLKL